MRYVSTLVSQFGPVARFGDVMSDVPRQFDTFKGRILKMEREREHG